MQLIEYVWTGTVQILQGQEIDATYCQENCSKLTVKKSAVVKKIVGENLKSQLQITFQREIQCSTIWPQYLMIGWDIFLKSYMQLSLLKAISP